MCSYVDAHARLRDGVAQPHAHQRQLRGLCEYMACEVSIRTCLVRGQMAVPDSHMEGSPKGQYRIWELWPALPRYTVTVSKASWTAAHMLPFSAAAIPALCCVTLRRLHHGGAQGRRRPAVAQPTRGGRPLLRHRTQAGHGLPGRPGAWVCVRDCGADKRSAGDSEATCRSAFLLPHTPVAPLGHPHLHT